MRCFSQLALRRFIVLLLVGVAGCQSTPAPPPPPPSFTRYQPIMLDVGSIDVVDEYKSPERAPNVEYLLPYPPTEAMHIWVRDRLRATGSDKTLQVIIKNASVIATPLATQAGVGGFFTDQQDKRYDAHLSVELRIYGNGAMSEANLTVDATHTITIRQSASVEERRVIFSHMIQALMDSANAELEKNIFQYFGNYVNYSQMP